MIKRRTADDIGIARFFFKQIGAVQVAIDEPGFGVLCRHQGALVAVTD